MPATPGTRLGPYEILVAIGAGGMGEVYKARDTRLGRTVAIKILPDTLSSDPQFRQRFDSEARTISQLAHPHICTLHDVGEQDGTAFLVMEYLEGETLEQRLRNGALPLEQALQYAIQIADALSTAHHAGIVHRDLKPGNVMLTKNGAKLLDFGLAKATAPTDVSRLSMMTTTPPNVTAPGTIVGTFQYMAPEQLEGQEADSRTDIFAFGATVYEMLTGRKAFEAKSQASLISAIISSEPPSPSTIQPLAPEALDSMIAICLKKVPDERWESVRDIAIQLRSLPRQRLPSAGAETTRRRGRLRIAAWGILAITCVGAVVFALTRVRGGQPASAAVRFIIALPRQDFAENGAAVSPDGRWVAFISTRKVWIRSIDSLGAQPVPGTEEVATASTLFWSPDSRRIGFFAQGKLKTVEPRTGPPNVVCDAGIGRGATWNRDGIIVFAPSTDGPLMRVPANGGTPVPASTLDLGRNERSHRWPQFLPDGNHFLYFARSPTAENTGVYVGQLGSPRVTRVMTSNSAALFASPDELLFWRAGSLLAQPFDTTTFQFRGSPLPVAPLVAFNATSNHAQFSVSDAGVLTYTPTTATDAQLTWVARDGTVIGTVGPPGTISSIAVSSDQTKAALTIGSGESGSNIWIADLNRGLTSRLTFERGRQLMPIWSPDGSELVFAFQRPDFSGQLFRQRVDGGAARPLAIGDDTAKFPTDWTRDGKSVIYHAFVPSTQSDIWIGSVEGGDPRPVIQTPFLESNGRLSPDGRWIAYASDESDEFQVYVQSFPPNRGKWRISTNGGRTPEWRRDGRELYFIESSGRIVAVPVNTATGDFQVGAPQMLFDAQLPLFEFPNPMAYAAAAGGQKFLMVRSTDRDRSTSLVVVLNWQEELRQRGPAK